MTVWTEQESEMCLQVWQRGGSYGVIADVIRTKTRSAVAGWLRRAGKRRQVPIETKVPPPRKTKRQIIEEALSREYTFDPTRLPSSLIDRSSDGCQFPLGEKPFRFCNQKRVPSTPYCAAHCKLVYQPPRPR